MIRLIAAVDQKMGIAKQGRQPWSLPADEQYFREQTMRHGGVLLMGRKTHEVISRALPRRISYVLSRDPQATDTAPAIDSVHFIPDPQLAVQKHPDLWVIGGADVYRQLLPQADELYLTIIAADFGCDQFFPGFADQGFIQVSRSLQYIENGLAYRYEVYTKAP
jgi:dihydrofolate reductase